MTNKRFVQLAALFLSCALLFQGCKGIPVPVNAHAYSAPAASATPAQPVTANTAPTQTSPVTAAVAMNYVPAAPLAEADETVVNSHSASDSQNVYYISDDGVHCMNPDGSRDRLTGIRDCNAFLALDSKGLYYLTCDDLYVPVTAEQEWGTCQSFNLMLYHTDTGKTEKLMPHVLNACPFGRFIYAVDHTDHAHILRYDMDAQAFSDVTGFPVDADASDWVDVRAIGGGLYLDCSVAGETETFAVMGSAIGSVEADPADADEVAGQGYQVDELTGKVSVWTGTAWQVLPLTGVNDVIPYGTDYYILAGDPSSENVMALYQAAADGTVKIVARPVAISGCTLVIDEIAGGWYFAFGVKEEGGTVDRVLMKYRIG